MLRPAELPLRPFGELRACERMRACNAPHLFFSSFPRHPGFTRSLALIFESLHLLYAALSNMATEDASGSHDRGLICVKVSKRHRVMLIRNFYAR
jgi:hypothetical protein